MRPNRSEASQEISTFSVEMAVDRVKFLGLHGCIQLTHCGLSTSETSQVLSLYSGHWCIQLVHTTYNSRHCGFSTSKTSKVLIKFPCILDMATYNWCSDLSISKASHLLTTRLDLSKNNSMLETFQESHTQFFFNNWHWWKTVKSVE